MPKQNTSRMQLCHTFMMGYNKCQILKCCGTFVAEALGISNNFLTENLLIYSQLQAVRQNLNYHNN